MNKFVFGGCLVGLLAFAGIANAADSNNAAVNADAPSVTTVDAPAVSSEQISQFEFMKKKTWLCTCMLKSDADGSTAGKWQGTTAARTRTGAEKIGANKACEAATAQHGVDCKKCSCGPAGAKPFGTKIFADEKAKAAAAAKADAAKAAATAKATAEANAKAAADSKAAAEAKAKAAADSKAAEEMKAKAKAEDEAKAKAEAEAKAKAEADAKAKAEAAAKAKAEADAKAKAAAPAAPPAAEKK